MNRPITWKSTGVIVSAVAGIIGLGGFAIPILRSEPAPWAGVKSVMEINHNLHEAKNEVIANNNEIRAEIMYNRIFSLSVHRCQAKERGETHLADALAEQIFQWEQVYQRLTRNPLPVKMCSEL